MKLHNPKSSTPSEARNVQMYCQPFFIRNKQNTHIHVLRTSSSYKNRRHSTTAMNTIYHNFCLIIGRTPRFIIPVILLVLIILIPYPSVLIGEVTIVKVGSREACAVGMLPYRDIDNLKEGYPIKVNLDGFEKKEAGIQTGYLTHINTEIKETPQGAFFSYTILLDSNPFLHKGMKGEISINLPYKSLLTRGLELFKEKTAAEEK